MEGNAVEHFIVKHADKITGVLSCFDPILFKGYLRIGYPEGMEAFLNRRGVLFKDFKSFALACSETLKAQARAIAQRDGVTTGLVCVFSAQESSNSFRLRYGEGRPRLTSCKPRCLCLYFYYLDRDFGLMHVRIPTWFPFTVQVCMNGHEWLARKMDRHGIDYTQVDNAFARIAEPQRAQRFADRFAKVKFPRVLEALSVVDDPEKAYRLLHEVCRSAARNGRRRRGLNSLRQDDLALFSAVLRGEHFIHGFRNRDLSIQLGTPRAKDPRERTRHSARVTRLIQLLHAHHLIAKIPRSRRWRVTVRGATLMSAAVHLFHHHFPEAIAKDAA